MALMQMMSTSVTGMISQQFRLEAIADNIANLDTTGFKSGRVDFHTLLSETIRLGSEPQGNLGGVNPIQAGTGVGVASTSRDFSQGAVTPTGTAGDLAIDGTGFFILRDGQGNLGYTRDGSFALDAGGFLYDPGTGFFVQGVNADLSSFTVPSGGGLETLFIPLGDTLATGPTTSATLLDFTVDADGTVQGIFDDSVTRSLGRVSLARFINPNGLGFEGSSLFRETAASGSPLLGTPDAGAFGSLVDRSLESSNVNFVAQLTDLVVSQRTFQANARVFSRAEGLLEDFLNVVKGTQD